MISEGVKKAKVDISSRRKMDFDFFVLQCKQLREWTRERATKEWMDIDKDPNNFADNGGAKGSRKRLYIPPYIFCAEAEDDVTENFQTKSVATTSKGKEMTAQERGSLVEECKNGFKELA